MLEPTAVGVRYERRRVGGSGAVNEAVTVALESVDAAVRAALGLYSVLPEQHSCALVLILTHECRIF
jgi:hypothetical protein